MLFRKMLRDMRANKTQFMAIFIMIFLGVFIYTGVNSDWNGMKVSSEKFYKETRMADVWVYGNGFSREDVKAVRSIDAVEKVERRASFKASVKGNKKKKIEVYLVESTTLANMKVMKGESFHDKKDGIWIDQSYATKNHLQIGDEYTLESHGISMTKEIKGLILHPEMVYRNSGDTMLPDYENSGYAFISSDKVSFAEQIPFTQLLIKTQNPNKMESYVSDALRQSSLTFLQKKDLPSYATLQSEITQHQAFGDIFPIVFLLIAVLTTMTTVSKMILNQRLQIGILKALGFQNRKVIRHYLSHVIVIASLGAILGFIIGPMVIPALIFPMMNEVYKLPSLEGVPLSSSILMVIGSIAVCFLVAYLVCRKQLKEKPAMAIRPVCIVYKRKHTWYNNHWNRMNFYAQWNIRDIFRNKIRSLIAVLGVAGCMGLMICAFGMQNSMDHLMDMMFKELQTYDMRITINEGANVSLLQDKMDGTRVMEGAIELKSDKLHKTGSLTVQEDTRYLKLQNTDLQNIALPQRGVVLSYNIAKAFQLKVGDAISWRVMGEKTWNRSVIKEIIHTPSSQGITMSKVAFEQSHHVFTPTAIVGKKAEVKGYQGVSGVQYLKEDIATSMDTMMEGMNLMIMILILGAVVLGLVVLYNIGTFSYFEKVRDMATLKVLGFSNKRIKKLLRQQNLWLTVIGILLGLPFGYALIYTVISTVGETMDLMIRIEPITYIGCTLFTLIISILVMMFVSRKTKTIDMVSALKAME